MSVKAIAAVWDDLSVSNKTDLLVLLAIADHCNDKCEAWPGIEHLALKARCSQRTVQKVLSGLCVAGKLEVQYNAGPQKTNIYRLLKGGGAGNAPRKRRSKKKPQMPP